MRSRAVRAIDSRHGTGIGIYDADGVDSADFGDAVSGDAGGAAD